MTNFKTRLLTPLQEPTPYEFLSPRFTTSFGFVLLSAALVSLLYGTAKAEFYDPLPSVSIKLQIGTTWILPGGTEAQNDVLKKCQTRLKDNGLPPEAIKYGCSILVSENERLDPLRLGDQGHAFGICQRNLGRVYAKDFLAKNPEWKTLDVQLDYCTTRFTNAWNRYQNVFQAVVEHNSPAAAAKNRDACHISPCYFQRVTLASQKLSPL